MNIIIRILIRSINLLQLNILSINKRLIKTNPTTLPISRTSPECLTSSIYEDILEDSYKECPCAPTQPYPLQPHGRHKVQQYSRHRINIISNSITDNPYILYPNAFQYSYKHQCTLISYQ